MALSDKNILIIPNKSQSLDPQIIFSGADGSTSAQDIVLQVYPTDNGTLSFEGSAGQLFSVTNSLSGTIFSVNDISGIPSIEVLDTGLIKLAQFSGNVLIHTGIDNTVDRLQVNGSISATKLSIGTLGYTAANALLTAQSSIAGINQLVLQNSNTGTSASADIVVNNNNSTDTTYYGNFGINSGSYTGSGSLALANASYLTATTGDLVLGTTTSNAIHFIINSGATDALTISTAGVVTLGTALTSSSGGTGNAFTKFTGPTTAEKTFTLPDANATILYAGGALGTPASGVVTNLTGTATINIIGTSTGLKSSITTGLITISGPAAGSTRAKTLRDIDDTILESGGSYTLTGTWAFNTATAFPAGTALLPSIAIAGDLNTGFWFPTADTVALSTGGAERVRVDASGNLGIGNTPSGTYKLQVTGKIAATDQIVSSLGVGTAPLAVTSTTKVTNLNSDLLDDQEGSYYRNATNINAGLLSPSYGGTGNATFVGIGSVTATATSKTLVAGEFCTFTTATQTATLPANPTVGIIVAIGVTTFTDTIIGRNSQLLMSLSEDMIINRQNTIVMLMFVGSTVGWELIDLASTLFKASVLNLNNVWTKSQRTADYNLTSTSGTIAVDFSYENFYHVTTENTILAFPTNLPGTNQSQSGVIKITQGATPRTMTFASGWIFPDGYNTLTATGGAVNIISYLAVSSTVIYAWMV